MQIYTLFPITVGKTDIGRKFTNEELTFIKKLDFIGNHGNLISQNKNVLDTDELADLKRFCLTSINDYMNGIYQPKNNVYLRITQSWVNVTQQGQNHHKHHHDNSIFSASFYIETNDEDCIYFDSPNKNLIKMDAIEHTPLNASSWWLPATTGSLLMFPSWLKHEVKNKNHDGNRISLSFNTFVVGEVGVADESTQLILGNP